MKYIKSPTFTCKDIWIRKLGFVEELSILNQYDQSINIGIE